MLLFSTYIHVGLVHSRVMWIGYSMAFISKFRGRGSTSVIVLELFIDVTESIVKWSLCFPVSLQGPAPLLPTSWPLAGTTGVARTRTQATTPRVISPRTMRGYRCYCLIDSLASSWCQHKPPGTTTLWVRSHYMPDKLKFVDVYRNHPVRLFVCQSVHETLLSANP